MLSTVLLSRFSSIALPILVDGISQSIDARTQPALATPLAPVQTHLHLKPTYLTQLLPIECEVVLQLL